MELSIANLSFYSFLKKNSSTVPNNLTELNDYVFNFPTKCTCTIEYLYFSLNIFYMFRRSLRHPQEELLIATQNLLLIVSLLQWLSYRAWNISHVGFLQSCLQLLKNIRLLLWFNFFFKYYKPLSKACWRLLVESG